MLFGHHEFDDPTIQGNSFYIKIVYSPDSVDGFGSNTWFFIGGRKDALTVRCDDLEAWLGHGGKFGSEWWDSPIVSGGDLGDFYGFFMGIYDEFLHEKCWWLWVAVLLNPCWQRCFFFGTSCRDDSCKRENCYRPRTNHSFVGFIPISAKNRWFKVI